MSEGSPSYDQSRLGRAVPVALLAGLAIAGSAVRPQEAGALTQIAPEHAAVVKNSQRIANAYWQRVLPRKLYEDYIASGCYRNLKITQASDASEMMGGAHYETGVADGLAFLNRPVGDPNHCEIRLSARVYKDGNPYTCGVVSHEIGHQILKDYFNGELHSKLTTDLMNGPVSNEKYEPRDLATFLATAPFCQDPVTPQVPVEVKDKEILRFMAVEQGIGKPEACRTFAPVTAPAAASPVKRFLCRGVDQGVVKVAVYSNLRYNGDVPNAAAHVEPDPEIWDRNRERGGQLVK